MYTTQTPCPNKLSSAINITEPKGWLSRLNRIFDKNANATSLKNDLLAQKLFVSERHLNRKVKELTGLSPQKYLRKYRLCRAKTFLENGKYRTVSETAYAVGFSKIGYFTCLFEKEFGKKPLDILQENGWR